jgi:hypothetical protein
VPKGYTRAELDAVLAALRALPPGSPLIDFAADYDLLIRAARRCRGEAT